jgi:hypothetical protein
MQTTTREAHRYKKSLDKLTAQVCKYLARLDELMKQPSSNERGQEVAKLSNALDMANDAAMHLDLNMSFQQINNRKKKAARKS